MGDDCPALSRQQCEALRSHMHDFVNFQTFFIKLRVRARNLRSKVEHERKEHLRKRQFVCDSLKETITSLSERKHNVSSYGHLPSLTGQWQRIAEDQGVLDEQTESLRHLEEQLSNVEFEMQKWERRLAESATQVVGAIQSLDLPCNDQTLGRPLHTIQSFAIPRSSGPGTPPVDTVLQNYYDKAGERKVLQERLIELEYQHSENRSRHILAQDQEMPLSQTLEEFEVEHDRERAHLQQAMDYAFFAEKAARAACLEANLDPDAHEKVQWQEEEEAFSVEANYLHQENLLVGDWRHQPSFQEQHDLLIGLPLDQNSLHERQFPMIVAADGGLLTSITPGRIQQEHVQERINSWISEQKLQQPDDNAHDQDQTLSQSHGLMPEERSTPAANTLFDAPPVFGRHPFEEPVSRPPMIERRSSDSFVLVIRHRPGIYERTLDHIRSNYGAPRSSNSHGSDIPPVS